MKKMSKGKVFTFLVLLISSINVAFAQKVVTGKVVDTSGEALCGVHVSEVGTTNGAFTQLDGTFSITVKGDGSTVMFRYLGMQPVKQAVSGKKMNITMQDDVSVLQEAVVVSTGYQKLSRERSTASYGFVDSTALTRVIHKDLLSALEGQVAGLRMNKNPNTGGNSPIIRGVGTFSSSVGTEPLIVIDEIPTSLKLDEINPHDVESITVLKDAAASSIYGALAANGVIVITTKQGKTAKTKVSVNADWRITTKPSFDAMHYASSSDIIDYETEVFNSRVANSGGVASLFSSFGNNYYSPVYQLYRDQFEGKVTQEQVDATLNSWRKNDYYEQFRKYAWRNQFSQRYNVSLSQQTGKDNHYASFSYENNKGRALNDESNTFTLYFKSTFNITKWLNIKVGADARMTDSQSPNGSYTSYNIQERYASIKDAAGNLVYTPNVNISGYVGSAVNRSVIDRVDGAEGLMPFRFNVLESLDESITNSKNFHLRPFVNAEVKFAKFLKYNLLYQYEWTHRKQELYDEADTYLMRMTHNAFITPAGKCILPEGGRYMQQSNTSQRYTFRNQLGFDHSWDSNRHILTAIMGLELRENFTPRMVQQLMYGYNDTALTSSRLDWQSLYTDGWESLVYDQTLRYSGLPTSQTLTKHRYASFYANAGYTLMGKYNFNGSIRWDETDLFGLDTKEQHHPLWSAGLGWNISQEEFMKDITWLDYLKLRMTYGINGNVDQTSSTYFVARYRTISQDPTATPYLNYSDDNLPNPKLRWERTSTFNFGFDFRIFKGILSGSIEYYNRTGSDLLVRKYLDSTLGASQRVINNGKMRNQGVEISLRGNILHQGDWDLSASATLGINHNKMLKVEHSSTDVASNFITAPMNYFIQGTSYNTLWAYKFSRIVNGYPVILDADGKEMVTFDENGNPTDVTVTSYLKGTDALVNCGSVAPTYNGSFQLNLRWKNLEANALMVYAGGNKLRMDVADMNSYSMTSDRIKDRWTPGSTGKVRLVKDIPTNLQQYASTFADWWRYSDQHIKSAAYLKLRSISLSYIMPDRITNLIGFGTTKFSFQVNNLFYISAAGHDIDPESYGLNSGSRSLTQPRTFSLGFSTSF